ncbi:ribulose-phosphate 3-epimerase [Buchnera aphidicola]|uniref:Ribulose-phosphate 3-epimerase n=1 Tax=Buchnera aphidicola (Sarucallis kahawaluokalani) TaxID=1241878 RepID=A0A4D6YIJ9_9GAMM|nr:ribulose-phosphate 3-epimerase [Buchnera aphidicola]QCI26201.1 ribulose-phosphate 3-epimerase [Buchnera aphidicola (Sarucallis kahawaluokalani)]
MKKIFIAPSILSANFAKLGQEVQEVLLAGSDIIHFDVMDNHYVPNLTFGPMVLKSLREYKITAPIDVHLMIQPVDSIIPSFAKAGANFITFHPETSDNIKNTLSLIKSFGCKSGLAINPGTSLSILDEFMDQIDIILLMSVAPGFSNQKFISSTLNKIYHVRKKIDRCNSNILLEVDGGININNIIEVVSLGVDIVVMGSFIFQSKDYKKTISIIKNKLNVLHI